jgi:glycosyltransferase involved in cell wall biosynthesis
MWVAGRSQFHYARQLHFPANRILSGLYSADTNHFKNTLKHTYNKELLFVGRFEKEKGVEDLYRIFKAMSPEEKNGWTLRMIGNGSLKKGMESSSDMFLEPFMQPATLVERTRSAGAFILPSLNEHWGVVVHEFAASALPLVLSEHVNAGEEYLIANYNGFIFRDKGSESLREVLIRLFAMDPADLSVMGARSQELALRFTPDLWAAVFLSTLEAKYQSGINYRSDDH